MKQEKIEKEERERAEAAKQAGAADQASDASKLKQTPHEHYYFGYDAELEKAWRCHVGSKTKQKEVCCYMAVSYTHLTLPTIYSV